MTFFTVTAIIDGDTFLVSPCWQWQGQRGNRVRPVGFDTPNLEMATDLEAKRFLEHLVLGHTVELCSAYRVDRGRLVCEVYFDGLSLANYYPRFQA